MSEPSILLPTMRRLKSDADRGGDQALVRFEAAYEYAKAASNFEYKYSVTLTSEYPLTDPFQAEEAVRQIYHRFTKRLFARQEPCIGFFTVIESHHELSISGRPRFHAHSLVGDAIKSHRDPTDDRNKSLWLNVPNHLKWLSKRVYVDKRKKTTFNEPYITEITIQPNIIDYLHKKAITDDLFVAVHASNLKKWQ